MEEESEQRREKTGKWKEEWERGEGRQGEMKGKSMNKGGNSRKEGM